MHVDRSRPSAVVLALVAVLALGHLTADGAYGVEMYEYDAAGTVDYAIDAKNQTTDFTADLAGRLTTLTPAAGAAVGYTYDRTDRLLTTADVNGTTTFGYDPLGRLTSVLRGGRTTSYAYDDAGRPTSVTYPGGAGPVGYAYDSAGRLATITDWANRTTTFGYDDASRVASLTRPGGLTSTITYDELNRPLSATHVRNSTTLLALGYTYDANGNVATLSDDTGTAAFGYDDLDRLTAAAYPGAQSYIYGYDAVGNTLSATSPAGTRTYTYDLADRITSAGPSPGVAPTYDENGNITSDGSYGNRTYTYDALGRLTDVVGNGVTAYYSLDGDGNRWAQTINGLTTSFDLDLSVPNATILADGSRLYLPADPAAGYAEAGTWWSALANELGSPIEYVSQVGATTSPVHYDPYGRTRPGSPDPVGIGYGGEWQDASGLVNLRFRAYDPLLGRFTGRDTFGGVLSAPQTGNRYAYALANPLRYSDPSGHFVGAVLRDPGLWASLALQSIPGPGDAYSALIAGTGFDPIAGLALSADERLLAGASALAPGAFTFAKRIGNRLLDRFAESRIGGRLLGLETPGGVFRVGDDLTAARGIGSQRQALLNRVRETGSLSEAKGVVYAARQMEQRGPRLVDASLAYRGRQGVDLVFSKGGTYAIMEAKAGSGINRLRTYGDLRQGSMEYIDSRLARYLRYGNGANDDFVRVLQNEAAAGRLESYASFYRGQSLHELPPGWPLVPSVQQ